VKAGGEPRAAERHAGGVLAGQGPCARRQAKELIAVHGRPIEIGGYYHPDLGKVSKAMRPSATFDAALAQLAG
jgi:monomeric isocitrate dehydrogenase